EVVEGARAGPTADEHDLLLRPFGADVGPGADLRARGPDLPQLLHGEVADGPVGGVADHAQRIHGDGQFDELHVVLRAQLLLLPGNGDRGVVDLRFTPAEPPETVERALAGLLDGRA